VGCRCGEAEPHQRADQARRPFGRGEAPEPAPEPDGVPGLGIAAPTRNKATAGLGGFNGFIIVSN